MNRYNNAPVMLKKKNKNGNYNLTSIVLILKISGKLKIFHPKMLTLKY